MDNLNRPLPGANTGENDVKRTAIIPAGIGYNVGHDFNRASEPTEIEINHEAQGCVWGYIAGDPQHRLGFMRAKRIYVSVRASLIQRADNA